MAIDPHGAEETSIREIGRDFARSAIKCATTCLRISKRCASGLIRLQESGAAVPSGTRVDGRYAIRCAIVNHRSRREDFDLLVEEVVRTGRRLAA